MKNIQIKLLGANGNSLGSLTVSEKFLAEAHRLKVDPSRLLSALAAEFAETPPVSIVIPKLAAA
jgi:hypothetical protein